MTVVLLTGELGTGFCVFGPFNSASDAVDFAENERFSNWEIMKLYTPILPQSAPK
jgi:hypothetical protein